MYIRTIKLSRTVFVAAVVTVGAAAVLAAATAAQKLAGGKKVYKVQTEQQRQALISELGWETGDKPAEHKTITIPAKSTEPGTGVNELVDGKACLVELEVHGIDVCRHRCL